MTKLKKSVLAGFAVAAVIFVSLAVKAANHTSVADPQLKATLTETTLSINRNLGEITRTR